jgi:hypothetical protein
MAGNDELVHKLERVLNYSRTIGVEEQAVLKSAIAAIHTPDHDLANMVEPVSTVLALLEMLTSPAKFKAQLNDLNNLLKSAREERTGAAQERAALVEERIRLDPEIKSAREAHARRMADAEEAFNQKCAQFQATIASREAAVSALEKLAAADRAAAATAKADADRRLQLIKNAAA